MELKLARTDDGRPEIFRSVQGEGPMSGRARTFVRFSGCNLHCVWCDTAYTWNWRGGAFAHVRDRPGAPHTFDPAAEMAKLSVAETAALVRACGAEALVITGGEPLLQSEGVAALIDALGAPHVEIETNGTIAPSPALVARVALFVVSPKLPHAGNGALAIRPEALAAFATLENAVFKIVVRESSDLQTVAALAQNYAIAPDRIWIMPEGVDAETLAARGAALIDAVIAAGWNYTGRLHIALFGARRGV
ncbi:MAG: radical SAM protein [Alphaproteobacteria bacterium]|nr:radical SAM protein [Alphaproteobacteria bacterium]